jgi:hypothetical protein
MAQGMRQGTRVLFPNMNGKEEEKEGAACMAGKPILPVMHNMENKIKLCPRTSVNITVIRKQNIPVPAFTLQQGRCASIGSGVYKTSSDTTQVPCTTTNLIRIQIFRKIFQKKFNIS